MKDFKKLGAVLAFFFIPILVSWLIIGWEDGLSTAEVVSGIFITLIAFGGLGLGLSKIKYPDK